MEFCKSSIENVIQIIVDIGTEFFRFQKGVSKLLRKRYIILSTSQVSVDTLARFIYKLVTNDLSYANNANKSECVFSNFLDKGTFESSLNPTQAGHALYLLTTKVT